MPTRPPRTRPISRSAKAKRSAGPPRPSSSTRPAVTRPGGGTRPSTERAVRVLPEPDSPTRPTNSPRPTVSETPRTTGVHWPAMGNEISRSWIERRGTMGSARLPSGAGDRLHLRGEAAEPVHGRGHAEAGGPGQRIALLGLEVDHPGDVDVGPALDAADELREERCRQPRPARPAGGVTQIGVRALHLLQEFGIEGQPPQALAV